MLAPELSGFLTSGFTGNVFAGIVASALTLLCLFVSRRLKNRQDFSKMTGKYSVHALGGSRVGNEEVTVKWLGDRIISVRSFGGDGDWESTITMDMAVPNIGNGYYNYIDRYDFGIHQIKRNIDAGTILVFAHNPGIPKGTVAVVWKPK